MTPLRVPADVLARLTAAGTRGRLWASLRAAWTASQIAAAHLRRERAWRLVRAAHRAYVRALRRAS